MHHVEDLVFTQAARCRAARESRPTGCGNTAELWTGGRRRAAGLLALTTLAAIGMLTRPTASGAQTETGDDPPAITSDTSGAPGTVLLKDVPMGQPIAVTRVLFDLEGYQVLTQSGDTIAVPFVDHNMDVMRFGRSASSQPYFVNENQSPALYLPANFSLQNAADTSARWYPLPTGYSDPRPAYISMAPTWQGYSAMNWYPDMAYYGGRGGFSPTTMTLIPNSYISIAGRSYTPYNYRVYYTAHPGFLSRNAFNYYVPVSTVNPVRILRRTAPVSRPAMPINRTSPPFGSPATPINRTPGSATPPHTFAGHPAPVPSGGRATQVNRPPQMPAPQMRAPQMPARQGPVPGPRPPAPSAHPAPHPVPHPAAPHPAAPPHR